MQMQTMQDAASKHGLLQIEPTQVESALRCVFHNSLIFAIRQHTQTMRLLTLLSLVVFSGLAAAFTGKIKISLSS